MKVLRKKALARVDELCKIELEGATAGLVAVAPMMDWIDSV
jgi:hypothetical protein